MDCTADGALSLERLPLHRSLWRFALWFVFAAAACLVLSCVRSHGGRALDSDVDEGVDGVDANVDVDPQQQEMLDDYLAQLPTALCRWYQSCGFFTGVLADCEQDVADEVSTTCAALATFYVDNQAALDACLDGSQGTCVNDDVDSFCPAFAAIDIRHICDPPPATGPGAACATDTDCDAGMRCLQSLLPGPTRYCAPKCSSSTFSQDCAAFVSSTYYLELPANIGATYNDWNNDVLWRVASCEDLTDTPTVGTPDGNSYCIWVCPDNSAGVYDANGAISSCACLPNYKKTGSDPMVCEWNYTPPYDCSLFNQTCTVENTAVSECSAGDFRCVLMESLEGPCMDFVTGNQIEACVAQCSWDCDTNCIRDRCFGGTPECIDQCCRSDNPACN